MKRAEYGVSITNGKTGDEERGFGYKVWWVNPPHDGAAKIVAGADGLLAAAKANQNPGGDLTATLTATIDGAANNPPPIKMDWAGVTEAEIAVLGGAKALLDATKKHHKDKKAKKHGGTPPGGSIPYGTL